MHTTTYTIWISDGSEVDAPGNYTVFGSIETPNTIDGNIHQGTTTQLDTDNELEVEQALADEIATAKSALEALAGTGLTWTGITDNYDAGSGWSVLKATVSA